MNAKKIEKKKAEYEKQGFEKNQLYQIYQGLEDGLDVSKYADPEFHWKQMKEIRLNLEKKEVSKEKEPKLEL